jgi:hypothetical protein
VSRFWLTYCGPSGRRLGLLIELDKSSAELVPANSIGRLLSQDEAAKLIRRIERGIPKRPAAPSVRRQVRRHAVKSG